MYKYFDDFSYVIFQVSSGQTVRDQLNNSGDIWLQRPVQPLYANAPPKPRRLNTSNDLSGSSPEPSTAEGTGIHQGSSGNRLFEATSNRSESIHRFLNTSERRTPDVYGAAATSAADYEEIYDDRAILSGLQSPKLCIDKTGRTRDSYASNKSNVTRISDEFVAIDLPKANDRRQLPAPRPHSADFLEYDRSRMSTENPNSRTNCNIQNNRVRSQSSMGHEIDYWSEENYAQKMRQSSLYHSKNMSKTASNQRIGSGANGMGPRVPPAGAATPDLYTNVRQPPIPELSEHCNNIPSAHHFNALKYSDRLNTSVSDGNTTDTVVERLNTSTSSSNTMPQAITDSKSFSRSASARLPRGKRKDDSLDSSLADDPDDPDNKRVYQVHMSFLCIPKLSEVAYEKCQQCCLDDVINQILIRLFN